MSKEVKRYTPEYGADMLEDEDGAFARADGYEALLAENARLESAWHVDVMKRKDELIDMQEKENDRVKAELAALLAERDELAEKVEKVRSRCVSVSSAPDAVIPNALDAWGRPVKQFLPYDFSGNPGASATQYCNGWNDSGSYWKAHCVDIQVERDALKKDAERYRFLMRELGGSVSQVVMGSPVFSNEDVDAAIDAALKGEQP